MNYIDGQVVSLGDQVKLPDDLNGIVVAIIDSGEYSAEFREVDWNYLKTGILVNFPQIGLIHYEVPEDDLELVLREGG